MDPRLPQMEHMKNIGLGYLKNRFINSNDAVMFDIDDTLIFVSGVPNLPIIELLHEAINMGYAIIIITARPGIKGVIDHTIQQLGYYKINYNYLGFTSPETKYLMKQRLPYHFVLSVGDMPTDLSESEHFLNISNFSHM